MIELKKLHESFLMHQAFLAAASAAAAAASSAATTSSSSPSSSSTNSSSLAENLSTSSDQQNELDLSTSNPKSLVYSPSSSSSNESQYSPKKRLIQLDSEERSRFESESKRIKLEQESSFDMDEEENEEDKSVNDDNVKAENFTESNYENECALVGEDYSLKEKERKQETRNSTKKSSSFLISDILDNNDCDGKRDKLPRRQEATIPNLADNYFYGASSPAASFLADKMYQFYNPMMLQRPMPMGNSFPFLPTFNPIDLFKLLAMNMMNHESRLTNTSFPSHPSTLPPASQTGQVKIQQNESKKTTTSNYNSASNILSSLEELTKNQFKDLDDEVQEKSSSKKSSNSSKPEVKNFKESTAKSNNLCEKKNGGELNESSEQANSKSNNESTKSGNPGPGGPWPAWVYCTRYSDRPSAGPRNRKKPKKVNNNQPATKSKSVKHVVSKEAICANAKLNTHVSCSSSSSNSSYSLASPSQLKSSSSPFLAAMSSYMNSSESKKMIKQQYSSGGSGGMGSFSDGNMNENESKLNSSDCCYDDEENSCQLGENNNQENDFDLGGDDMLMGCDEDDDDDDDDDNDSNASHSKRPRTAFTTSQLIRLKNEFEKCKYLTGEKRQYLANELKLNESQIKIWFQNKRAKIKKSAGTKNSLAMQLMAQGLYNHRSANNK